MDSVNVYDLEPLLNDLGSGFSSGVLASDVMNKQIIQDAVLPSNSLLSSYNPLIFGSTSTSTMASLIASSLHQEKINVFGGFKDAQESNNSHGVERLEDMLMAARNSEGSLVVKDVKMEEGYNRLDWSDIANVNNQNNMEQINSSSDPPLLWNGAWLDPSNVGSSVPSLI